MRSTKVREKRPVGSAIGKAEEDLSWQCTFFPDVNEKRPSVACVIDTSIILPSNIYFAIIPCSSIVM
jgi:hypothetical protein